MPLSASAHLIALSHTRYISKDNSHPNTTVDFHITNVGTEKIKIQRVVAKRAKNKFELSNRWISPLETQILRYTCKEKQDTITLEVFYNLDTLRLYIIQSKVPPVVARRFFCLVDLSSSIVSNQKLGKEKFILGEMVDMLGDEDQMALMGFSKKLHLIFDYSSEKNKMLTAIDSMQCGGDKELPKVLKKSIRWFLKNQQKDDYLYYFIVCSDGLYKEKEFSAYASLFPKKWNHPILMLFLKQIIPKEFKPDPIDQTPLPDLKVFSTSDPAFFYSIQQLFGG